MTRVVDRSALTAILLGEPEGDALAVALTGAEMPVICAPNGLQAMMVISARPGRPGVQALSDLPDAAEEQVEPADADLVRTAFEAGQRFGKGHHPAGLNFGDGFAYALTSRRGDVLSLDHDFSQTEVMRVPGRQ
jgi:ribonuclease VapC